MAGITLEQAEAKLPKHLNAKEIFLLGLSINVDAEVLASTDLAMVQKGVGLWQDRVYKLSGGPGILEVISK